MRNGTGSSQRVYKGLELLFGVQSHLKSLQINSVFGSHNLDVISSYEFLSKYPVDKMYFSFSVEDNNEEAALEFVRQMSLVASRAFEKGGEVELRRIDTFDHLFLQLDSQIRIHNHCGAGKSFLVLDTDDNVHACNWLANESSERVGAKGQIDEHALGRYSTSLIELNHCHSCWARYLCGGGCMYVNKMKTGDKHQSDPSFCQKQKGLIQIGIDFYEKARRTEIG
jgi:uncharacterized protein